jgi:hypothetical protein
MTEIVELLRAGRDPKTHQLFIAGEWVDSVSE